MLPPVHTAVTVCTMQTKKWAAGGFIPRQMAPLVMALASRLSEHGRHEPPRPAAANPVGENGGRQTQEPFPVPNHPVPGTPWG